MRDKQYYQEKFKDYLDVVTLEQFRKMLVVLMIVLQENL